VTEKKFDEVHMRIGLNGEELYPGDEGYDNIPPTDAQQQHYAEQGMSAKELREHKAQEKKAEESLQRTITQSPPPKDADKK
jgi:hypothetical protein